MSKPSEQPVSRGMFQTSHARAPRLMDRQLNQRDVVASVPKNLSSIRNPKATGAVIKADIRNDCDNAEMTNAPKG